MEEKTGATRCFKILLPVESLTFTETRDYLVLVGQKYDIGDPETITVEQRVGEILSVPFQDVFSGSHSTTVSQFIQVDLPEGQSQQMVMSMLGHHLFPHDVYIVTYTSGKKALCGVQEYIENEPAWISKLL